MESRNEHQLLLAFFFCQCSTGFWDQFFHSHSSFCSNLHWALHCTSGGGHWWALFWLSWPDLHEIFLLQEYWRNLSSPWNVSPISAEILIPNQISPSHLSMVTEFHLPSILLVQATLGPELHTAYGAGKAGPWPASSSEFSCMKGLIYGNKQPHKSRFKPSIASWGFVLIKVSAQIPQRKPKNSSNFDSTKGFIWTKISTRTYSNIQWRNVWFRHSY